MPALNDVLAESIARNAQVQRINDALTGVTGKGVPIALVALNDPLNYALTVQNLDPTNSRALKVLKFDGTNLITADINGVTLGSPLNLVAGSIPGAALATGSVTSSTIADGTIQNVDLAAGVAATNVGALGGVLTGTLPSPGLAANSVGSSQLAANSVDTSKIVDGTIATADLAAGAITQVLQATANTTESTTSSSIASMVAPVVSITASGGVCVAWFSGTFFNSAAAGTADCQFAIRLDSATSTIGRFYNPGATWRFTVSMVLSLGALSGAHTVSIGWLTGAGTLSSDTTVRTLTVIEFKR